MCGDRGGDGVLLPLLVWLADQVSSTREPKKDNTNPKDLSRRCLRRDYAIALIISGKSPESKWLTKKWLFLSSIYGVGSSTVTGGGQIVLATAEAVFDVASPFFFGKMYLLYKAGGGGLHNKNQIFKVLKLNFNMSINTSISAWAIQSPHEHLNPRTATTPPKSTSLFTDIEIWTWAFFFSYGIYIRNDFCKKKRGVNLKCWRSSRGGNRRHSQLPSECNFLQIINW